MAGQPSLMTHAKDATELTPQTVERCPPKLVDNSNERRWTAKTLADPKAFVVDNGSF
jgi:hypothetical protein